MSFNPTTLSDTIQRILLREATIAGDTKEELNTVSDIITIVTKLDERLDRLEELCKHSKVTPSSTSTNKTMPHEQRGRLGHTAAMCYRDNGVRHNSATRC